MAAYNFKDITGKRFGYLVVIRRGRNYRTSATWICRCDCGTEKEIRGHDLRSGHIVSCSCQRNRNRNRRTHGMSRTAEYKAWRDMLARCARPTNKSFKNYGGRGIKVCQRWRDRFENFLADMGRKPSPELSIDRINNDGNYKPGNCRWATLKEQNNNQRPRRRQKTAA